MTKHVIGSSTSPEQARLERVTDLTIQAAVARRSTGGAVERHFLDGAIARTVGLMPCDELVAVAMTCPNRETTKLSSALPVDLRRMAAEVVSAAVRGRVDDRLRLIGITVDEGSDD